MLRHEPGEVGGSAERAAVHFGQAEDGVVRGDDDVGVADQADAAAHAEAVHGRDEWHLALIDGLEGGVAAAIGTHEGGVAGAPLHLFDVDAGVEAAALRAEEDDTDLGVSAGGGDRVGEVKPGLHRQGIHGWEVDHHLCDAVAYLGRDGHGALRGLERSAPCEAQPYSETRTCFNASARPLLRLGATVAQRMQPRAQDARAVSNVRLPACLGPSPR